MNKDLEQQLAQENEQLKKQIAELSKFKHERKGTSKKEILDQISTPAHISEFMRDLVQSGKKDHSGDIVIDISCGAGSLLIPWKDTNALLIGADIDSEALELCQQNLPQAILYKHNSLECATPCRVPKRLFSAGVNLERLTAAERAIQEGAEGEKIFVLNPPFSLAGKMVSKVLQLAKNE